MRKRTIKTMADTIFWYVLYFMPVIGYLLFMFIHPSGSGTVNPISFMDYLSASGFTVVQDNILYTSLMDIFGSNGLLPFFNSPVIVSCMTWYVAVSLIHIFIDFILLLPRILHIFFDKCTRGD